MTPTRIGLLIWTLIMGGLAAGIGVETDWGQRLARPLPTIEVSAAAFASPPISPPYSLPAPDTFLETSLRPLFVITRRPAPQLPDLPKTTMKKGQFILTGTTIVDDMRYAHLVEKANGKAHVLAEGKEINSILIKQVNPTRVTLSQGEENEEVLLRPPQTPLPNQPSVKKPPAAPVNNRDGSGKKTPPPFRKRRYMNSVATRSSIPDSYRSFRRVAP